MFLHCILASLLDVLLYALLTVGLVIVILPMLYFHCCFHLWLMKHSSSSTSSPRVIWTAREQILFLLAPLAHNSLNIICTKWWSSYSIFPVPYAICSWTYTLNQSWCLICKPYPSCLCTMLQNYFHCEWTIFSIPTTTPTPNQALSFKILSPRDVFIEFHSMPS